MLSDFTTLIFLAFIGSVAGLIGGLVILFKKNWARGLSSVSVPLAAGVLLAVSLLNLLPEAVDQVGDTAYSVVLLVFVIFFIIERFLFYLHHHYSIGEENHGKRHGSETAVPLVVFGDTIHNFLDGVAIAASFMVNPSLGWVVAFSTFLHETPHEIADFGILLSQGWSRTKAFLVNLMSALATFPGAILTYFFADRIESAVGILLATAAGLFLYVAATDFLPEVGHSDNKQNVYKQTLFLLLGIVLIVFTGYLVPDPH